MVIELERRECGHPKMPWILNQFEPKNSYITIKKAAIPKGFSIILNLKTIRYYKYLETKAAIPKGKHFLFNPKRISVPLQFFTSPATALSAPAAERTLHDHLQKAKPETVLGALARRRLEKPPFSAKLLG